MDIVGAFFVLHLLVLGSSLLGDPGVGWHLRTGDLILERGLPDRDPFSLASAPAAALNVSDPCAAVGPPAEEVKRKWVHDQWLSDLFLASLFRIDGGGMLHAATALVLIVTYVYLLGIIFKRTGPPSAVADSMTLLLLGTNGAVQWFIRPVIFSFLFVAITFVLLREELSSPGGRALRWMPLMFLIWANMHGGFFVGFALIGCALADALLRDPSPERRLLVRRLAWSGVFSVGATFVNPWGPRLHQSLLGVLGSEFFMSLNMEWLPPDFSAMLFLPFFAAAILLVGGVLSGAAGGLTAFELLAAVGSLTVALQQRRYIPFFAILAAPLLRRIVASLGEGFNENGALRKAAQSITRKESRSTTAGWTFATWFIVTLFIALKPPSDPHRYGIAKRFPEEAVDRLLAEAKPGERVFHTPDWGGYLIFRGWPRITPFIDDRNQLIGEQPYREFLGAAALLPEGIRIIDGYGFKWMLVEPGTPLASSLFASDRWERITVKGGEALLFRRVCRE